MYLMDLGSSTYTEFDYTDKIIDAYDRDEELMEKRAGLVHSHHTMNAFFSGTDQEELHEKAETGLYLSLIVNNDLKPCAKLAWSGKSTQKVIIQEDDIVWTWGSFVRKAKKPKKREEIREVLVIYEMEMDIEWPEGPAFDMMEDFEELKDENIAAEAKAAAEKAKTHTTGGRTLELPYSNGKDYRWPRVGQGGPQHSLAEALAEAEFEERGLNEVDLEQDYVVDQLKMVGQLDQTLGAILAGDADFRGNMMTGFEKLKLKVLDEIGTFEAQTEHVIKNETYAVCLETLNRGDEVVAEIISDLSLDQEEYRLILVEMRRRLDNVDGLISDTLVEMIKSW
jgi:hypothetical protein